MNSRKKYIGSGLPPIAGDFNVLNINSKQTLVTNRTLEDATAIADGYNHQFCKPVFPDKYFVQHKNNEL